MNAKPASTSPQALQGIRILDLSRILAGPFCTQILGDLGADIIKVERPGTGDDTRSWGPPYLKDVAGEDTSESAYYLSANRNKRSIAIDIHQPEGRDLIYKLLEQADVLIENFKVGGLAKYGLDYETLHKKFPRLIYCSITGFGQNGPLSAEPGYDFLAQGMAGLMAITGAPEGEPMKVGVALSDVMTGQNAAIGILAALRARETTGTGQHIDLALTDCTLAAMVNIAQYYLTSGKLAPRLGNAHSTIVPYQVFASQDGHIIIAVGNDTQFQRFCTLLGHPEWAQDARFARNPDRVAHRDILVPMLSEIIAAKPSAHWLSICAKHDVPCGPVNTMDQVFAMEQFQARAMNITMPHPLSPNPVKLVGSPLKLSQTPVSYDRAPPVCGQHTEEILEKVLDLSPETIAELRKKGICA